MAALGNVRPQAAHALTYAGVETASGGAHNAHGHLGKEDYAVSLCCHWHLLSRGVGFFICHALLDGPYSTTIAGQQQQSLATRWLGLIRRISRWKQWRLF
jgi:hypothetical protein